MSNPPDNYGVTTELKKVRQELTIVIMLFIAPATNVDISFNAGNYSSATNFTNKNVTNFITCPPGKILYYSRLRYNKSTNCYMI